MLTLLATTYLTPCSLGQLKKHLKTILAFRKGTYFPPAFHHIWKELKFSFSIWTVSHFKSVPHFCFILDVTHWRKGQILAKESTKLIFTVYFKLTSYVTFSKVWETASSHRRGLWRTTPSVWYKQPWKWRYVPAYHQFYCQERRYQISQAKRLALTGGQSASGALKSLFGSAGSVFSARSKLISSRVHF